MNPAPSILVVDDDRLVLATLAHGLSQAGFEVVDADNGDDAILLARERRPQLALLDIRMQGLSGFDVAEYLRDYCRIPFMFLSAFTDEDTISQVRALGALDCLSKPLDIGRIIPAVHAALRRAGVPAGDGAASSVEEGRAVRAPSLETSAKATTPATAIAATAAPVLTDPLPLAVGLLMHRYSLDRQTAWSRLQTLAEQQGKPAATVAQALLDAQEQLARAGPL